MKGGNYSFEVERYLVAEGEAGSRLELDGWIVSDSPVEAVRLAPPGAPPHAVSLRAQADDDDHRLLLHLRAEADGVDLGPLDAAWLEIDAANGDRLEFGIGHLFRPRGWMPPIVAFATGPADPSATIDAEVPDAEALAYALDDGFRALDHKRDLYLHRSGASWLATSHRYGIRFATALDATLNRTEARDAARSVVREAAAALLDALGRGAPMLVHRRTDTDTDAGALALVAALRARNPFASLLWIDPHRDAGAVAWFRAGADAPIDRALLVASAADDRDATLSAARDLLLSGR